MRDRDIEAACWAVMARHWHYGNQAAGGGGVFRSLSSGIGEIQSQKAKRSAAITQIWCLSWGWGLVGLVNPNSQLAWPNPSNSLP